MRVDEISVQVDLAEDAVKVIQYALATHS